MTSEEAGAEAHLDFIHRSDGKANWYFVCNRKDTPTEAVLTFRQSRLQPELWDPVTGKQRPLNDWRLTTEANPRTQLPYRFGPHESVFIVFREPAQKAKTGMDQAHYEDVQPITGPWKLHFDPQWH